MGMKGGLFNPFFTGNYANEYGYFSSGVTAEYQAVLDRATVLGFTLPSVSQQSADNTFVQTGKTQGWWTLLDLAFIFHYNNAALSSISTLNWRSPSANTLTHNTATGTYGVKGWKWNGTTSSGDTNYNPSTQGVNWVQNSACQIVYVETIPTTGTTLCGMSLGDSNRLLSANVATHNLNTSLNLTGGAVDMTGTGYRAINRSTSTALQLYNDLTKSDRTAASSAIASDRIRLGRSGTSADRSDAEIGAYINGGSLTETQHNQIRAALIARRTAIGL